MYPPSHLFERRTPSWNDMAETDSINAALLASCICDIVVGALPLAA
jgi:hypothetical protein